MSGDQPTISVIIVSYNTREMTLKCLRILYDDIGSLDADVWVVDNNSQDGSAEAIRNNFPSVHVIKNPTNAGFGAANNLAMQQASGKWFLLLNSDAFVKPGALEQLLACANRNPDAVVVGPRLVNEDGSLQISCYKFPSPARSWLENMWISSVFSRNPVLGDYRKWAHDAERCVDSVIGACMLVSREAFVRTGGFDERFFMYQEETDWQKTLSEQGGQVVFTPAAVVTHLGGASGKAESEKISAAFFTSLDLYERKHHGISGLIAVRLAMIIGCFLRSIAWAAVMILMPAKRASAATKSRFHARLLMRQATHWSAPAKVNH